MNRQLLGLSVLTLMSPVVLAANTPIAAQPTSCIDAQFKISGNDYWQSVNLTLTNNCGKSVDFQNATVNYKSTTPVNTSFWGVFSPLSYPDNDLTITSQPQADGSYLATLTLHFPSYTTAVKQLPSGKSFQIQYGVNDSNIIPASTNVYLSGVVASGSLTLANTSSQPTNVTQNYALVHVTANGQTVQDVQLPWKSSKIVSLSAGTYTITPENVSNQNGIIYQAVAIPGSVVLAANQNLTSNITYTASKPTGSLNIVVPSLPAALSGYPNSPTVLISQNASGAISKTLGWNTTTTIPSLNSGGAYGFSTGVINFNNYNCTPSFLPSTVIASATPPTTRLSYQCMQMRQDSVTVNVTNAPTSLSSIMVTLTPNDNSTPLKQEVLLSSGSGSTIVSLTDGVIYNLSVDPVPGYLVSFSPQPLTATPNATETISFAKTSTASGRIIGYLPGWETPPSAQSLASAGYTHIMVAFGVFSTTSPGAITSAFSTVTKPYIQSLQQAGIKVILSLGGASSSIPDTSVDFHVVLNSASSPEVFQQNFVSSLQSMINEYGFDGFDIDIEHGLNGGGTFTQPQGDIAVLANIINTMYNNNPNLLITLTPQVANISATSGFDATWGNYASLVMQTYKSLAWVGIQLYNTGCAYGIDKICYSPTTSPDFTVAMATDLLANWPSTVNGQATGFQPYIAYLKSSQIVVGYPAPNSSGASDASPVTPTATIKRALQCLKTATVGSTSCDGYIPPQAYGMIGGVFNWQVLYDQSNQYKFAKDLSTCVKTGVCT